MNGCHNRKPLHQVTKVQDGWIFYGESRLPRMEVIPDTMTKECQYTKSEVGQADPGCTGCKWKM